MQTQAVTETRMREMIDALPTDLSARLARRLDTIVASVTTPPTRPTHPGMTPAWFDRALHRAKMSDKVARKIAPGQWVVSSATVPGLSYLTTERECSCPAGGRYGRCCCRALVVFEEWVRKCQREETIWADGEPQPPRWTPAQEAVIDAFIAPREEEVHIGQQIAAALDAARERDDEPESAA